MTLSLTTREFVAPRGRLFTAVATALRFFLLGVRLVGLSGRLGDGRRSVHLCGGLASRGSDRCSWLRLFGRFFFEVLAHVPEALAELADRLTQPFGHVR